MIIFTAGQVNRPAAWMVLPGIRLGKSLYRVIEDFSRKAGNPQDRLYWEMTLDLGERLMKTNLEWIENVLEKIKKNIS